MTVKKERKETLDQIKSQIASRGKITGFGNLNDYKYKKDQWLIYVFFFNFSKI